MKRSSLAFKRPEAIKMVPTVKVLILTSFLLAVFFAMLTTLDNALLSKDLKLMVTKQPERVSELYFTNYEAIPNKLKTNQIYKIDFTTTNREYKNNIYTYQAIMIENSSKNIIATKKFSLQNNQSSKQQIQFIPTKPNALIKIIIVLLNKDQEIRFKAIT